MQKERLLHDKNGLKILGKTCKIAKRILVELLIFWG